MAESGRTFNSSLTAAAGGHAFADSQNDFPLSLLGRARQIPVLTVKDHVIRIATVAASATLLTGLALTVAPALTLGGAALGLIGWSGFHLAKTIYTADKHGEMDKAEPANLPRAFTQIGKRFSREAGLPIDLEGRAYKHSHNFIHAEIVDRWSDSTHFAYSQAMRSRMNPKSFVSVMAHEIGHRGYDGWADGTNQLLTGLGRGLRWALLGGVAKAALVGAAGPAAPLIAAALLAPYAINVSRAFNARNNELVNDRFAATVMGSILPSAQSHGAIMRFEKEMRDPVIGPMRDFMALPRRHKPKGDSFIPLTQDHPSRATRRRALHKFQAQAFNPARRREVNTALKGFS